MRLRNRKSVLSSSSQIVCARRGGSVNDHEARALYLDVASNWDMMAERIEKQRTSATSRAERRDPSLCPISNSGTMARFPLFF
jgi:hypothetical protein